MISKAVMETLMDIVPRQNIHTEEPLAKHTTFRVGGLADCLVEIENTEQLRKIQKYLRLIELPYTIVGCGIQNYACRAFHPTAVAQ